MGPISRSPTRILAHGPDPTPLLAPVFQVRDRAAHYQTAQPLVVGIHDGPLNLEVLAEVYRVHERRFVSRKFDWTIDADCHPLHATKNRHLRGFRKPGSLQAHFERWANYAEAAARYKDKVRLKRAIFPPSAQYLMRRSSIRQLIPGHRPCHKGRRVFRAPSWRR